MADRVDLHAGLGIDTTDFARLAKDLRAAEPALAKELAVRLRAPGEIIASDARGRAESASQTIPPSIKVRVSGATVAVVAGGNGIPLAGLMELGNKNSAGGATTFGHPVFGNRAKWVDQPMHPYLLPALDAHHIEAEAAIVDALDAVTDKFLTGRG